MRKKSKPSRLSAGLSPPVLRSITRTRRGADRNPQASSIASALPSFEKTAAESEPSTSATSVPVSASQTRIRSLRSKSQEPERSVKTTREPSGENVRYSISHFCCVSERISERFSRPQSLMHPSCHEWETSRLPFGESQIPSTCLSCPFRTAIGTPVSPSRTRMSLSSIVATRHSVPEKARQRLWPSSIPISEPVRESHSRMDCDSTVANRAPFGENTTLTTSWLGPLSVAINEEPKGTCGGRAERSHFCFGDDLAFASRMRSITRETFGLVSAHGRCHLTSPGGPT